VVTSGPWRSRSRRWPLLAVPFLLTALSGCGDGEDRYPSHLRYPVRTDPIVIEPLPQGQPVFPDPPGNLDQHIAKIAVPTDKGGYGGKVLDPKTLKADQRREISQELAKVFGTPAKPKVEVPEGVEDVEKLDRAVEVLKLDNKTLARGSMHYRRHCLHCHGVPGDGRGPTGPWLNPHPRDYRQGLFKFISTSLTLSNGRPLLGRKPRREDLLRTLHKGIDGTSMPSFALEGEEVLDSLVSYVIHLSLRGEVEMDTMKTVLANDELEKGTLEDGTTGRTIQTHVRAKLGVFLGRWLDSTESGPLKPEPAYKDADRVASITRGFKLFTDTKGDASCIGCHLDFGRQVPFRFDSWGTLVRPANLTAGAYRGGRRPIDLYWRIRGGIQGSQMPAMPAPEKKSEAADADPYWDLVNFVQALPYPNMLPETIRGKIYPAPESSASGQHARAD
jgi:mono/diheme cytochrome c family protein